MYTTARYDILFLYVKQITLQFTIVSTVAVPAPARLVPLPIPRAQSPSRRLLFTARQLGPILNVRRRAVAIDHHRTDNIVHRYFLSEFYALHRCVAARFRRQRAHRAVIVSHRIFHGARARDEPDETREREETRARPPSVSYTHLTLPTKA